MSRDKQIEGIVKDFCPLYQECGSCKRCNEDLDIDEEPCYYGYVANIIIDYGYRKSTEVAEEIFAEIENRIASLEYQANTQRKTISVEELKAQVNWILHEVVPETIAELKKKYTESENNNE